MTSPAKQSAASLPAIDMAGIIEATSQALIAVEKEKEDQVEIWQCHSFRNRFVIDSFRQRTT
jgi:DNA-binding XRE family transcriptional regulator